MSPSDLTDLLQKQYDRVVIFEDVSDAFKEPLPIQAMLAVVGDHNGAAERIVIYRPRLTGEPPAPHQGEL